jgi:hypothetical protein
VAIGLSEKKKIFCFPWMKPETVAMYWELWFEKLLKEITNCGGIVLFPTLLPSESGYRFDEIINL